MKWFVSGATRRRCAVAPAVSGLLAIVQGCGSGSTRTVTQAPETPPAPVALSVSATCGAWEDGTAIQQRTLAIKRAETLGTSVAGYIELIASACTSGRKALTLQEAIAAKNQPPPDPFADTRITGFVGAEVARSVRKSWNRCGANDVCMSGTYAYSVGCHQPDPQVRVLSCFVTTDKGNAGESDDSGYNAKATVNTDGSYSWGIDNS
jgi:hypothetical protein